MVEHYEEFDLKWTRVEILPAGTRVEIKGWEVDVLDEHTLHITDGDLGAVIPGTKLQLVEFLEGALHQAWNLPDDDPAPLATEVK